MNKLNTHHKETPVSRQGSSTPVTMLTRRGCLSGSLVPRYPARHIPCGCRRHRRGEGGPLAPPRPCAPRAAPTLSLQASSVRSCCFLLKDSVFHRSLGARFGSSSEKRDGLSVCVFSVCASPSSMISASSWPIAGECITPWPEEPLAR